MPDSKTQKRQNAFKTQNAKTPKRQNATSKTLKTQNANTQNAETRKRENAKTQNAKTRVLKRLSFVHRRWIQKLHCIEPAPPSALLLTPGALLLLLTPSALLLTPS